MAFLFTALLCSQKQPKIALQRPPTYTYPPTFFFVGNNIANCDFVVRSQCTHLPPATQRNILGQKKQIDTETVYTKERTSPVFVYV